MGRSMRATLRNEPWACAPLVTRPGYSAHGVPVLLDDDAGPWPPVPHTPPPGTEPLTLSLKARREVRIDQDGNPEWAWDSLLTDAAVIASSNVAGTSAGGRQERSDPAGRTWEQATLTVAYPPSAPDVPETASVRTSDGRIWDVTATARTVAGLVLTVQRVTSDG